MFRKYVIITLAALFFVGSTACTSKKAQDESADVESADSEIGRIGFLTEELT